jgi:Asp-tRNA(Asn)/Glu-tRNA(Gln) amidotransferase C subunit
MSYIRHSAEAAPISPETVSMLAQLVGLTVPPEDLDPLAAALRDQLASIEILDELDLTDVNPTVELDPRWHD